MSKRLRQVRPLEDMPLLHRIELVLRRGPCILRIQYRVFCLLLGICRKVLSLGQI